MTSSRSRTLSLRAPIANEEERALFQRRLSFTLLLVFCLAFGFWAIQLATIAAFSPSHVAHMFTYPSTQLQLATTLFALFAALLIRRGKHSTAFLDIADAATTFAICVGWATMIYVEQKQLSRSERGELVVLLASSYTLVTRAALVPSTTMRSLAIGAMSMAPVIPVTYLMYVAHPVANRMPIGPAIYAAIWATVGVACTTAISHVIYGLRQEVRKAMQLGQYLLEEKIGEGGMGVVYRASHALLRRPAAIKLLGSKEHGLGRFEREVQITAKLTHPNTVAVFDYGHTPDGAFYYAMEYLDGVTLEDLVVEHGAQPPRRVLHVLLQVCGALEEAHAAGLVHRDIKPANVMLTERGLLPDVVKVLDFGLVKELAPGADLAQSSINTVMGTPHYMAPEAILDPASIDGRADLYAVGAMAYYLLTGERVFDGSNLVEICSQHLHQEPSPPAKKRSDIPASVEKIVLACLAKKREERPESAAALADMIRDAQREVGEWSRAEAKAWWTERTRSKSGHVPQAKPVSGSDASVLGQTIAVALDDRGAA